MGKFKMVTKIATNMHEFLSSVVIAFVHGQTA